MNEPRKKLEAIGDGLLLAVARLYLREQHAEVSYTLHARIICHMISNAFLEQIARAEGIKGLKGEKLSDALEVAIAIHYYMNGFESVKVWLWRMFDKYLSIRNGQV
jgi:dsRNA-specific ribonuclease